MMVEGKKSFILYADYLEVFEALSDQEAGMLIKHILEYVNDENALPLGKLLNLVFIPIKKQLERDLKNWSHIRAVRSEAGKLGGKKSGESRRKASEANASFVSKQGVKRSKTKQNETNEAVTVTVYNAEKRNNIGGNVGRGYPRTHARPGEEDEAND